MDRSSGLRAGSCRPRNRRGPRGPLDALGVEAAGDRGRGREDRRAASVTRFIHRALPSRRSPSRGRRRRELARPRRSARSTKNSVAPAATSTPPEKTAAEIALLALLKRRPGVVSMTPASCRRPIPGSALEAVVARFQSADSPGSEIDAQRRAAREHAQARDDVRGPPHRLAAEAPGLRGSARADVRSSLGGVAAAVEGSEIEPTAAAGVGAAAAK